ncbi:MAG: hypothetical protein ACYS67_09770 [Planctomycetota bacterium]|jgi:hypothetical protein
MSRLLFRTQANHPFRLAVRGIGGEGGGTGGEGKIKGEVKRAGVSRENANRR